MPLRKFNTILTVFGCLIALTVASAYAADYQQCTVNSTCTIGEFLYNDEYAPITTATCTLTSRTPAGALLLDEQPLSAASENDGWYAYSLNTTGLTTGLYRSQICCNSGTDYLCLDKTFLVTAADLTSTDVEDAVWDADIASHETAGTFGETVQNISGGGGATAAEIWGYSGRSLTTFGTLTADIWGYSTRSLSTFGDLITNIWGNSSRTLTTDVSTKTDITNISSGTTNNITLTTINQELQEQRVLLEKVANAPIIETFIEEGEAPPSLEGKLEKTNQTIESIVDRTDRLDSDLTALAADWNELDSPQIVENTTSIIQSIGTTDQDSLRSDVTWLKKAWDNPLTSDLSKLVEEITDKLTQLNTRVDFYGKTPSTKSQLAAVQSQFQKFKTQIGKKEDRASTATLYGYRRHLENLTGSLTQEESNLDSILSAWSKTDSNQKQSQLAAIRSRILSLKLIPQSQVLGATTNESPEVTNRNQLLNLKALIEVSRLILAQFANKPIKSIWLEEGSIIFKALISNPSRVISQEVPLKFYLPKEIDQTNIIKVDEGVKVEYDPDKEAYYISGSFTLAAGQTRTFTVEVNDIWQNDDTKINSYRLQAEELLKPLKNTAYYGQGATLKSDIDVSLDKVVSALELAQTPEARIHAYRESQIELNGVEQKLNAMKELVASAGSTGSIFGFVGGVQAVAVWGLILILLTGFVFLALYMRTLTLQTANLRLGNRTISPPPTLGQAFQSFFTRPGSRKRTKSQKLAQVIFFALVSTSLTGLLASLYLRSIKASSTLASPLPSTQKQDLKQTTIAKIPPSPAKKVVLGAKTEKENEIAYFVLTPPAKEKINIYSDSDKSGLLTTLSESQIVASSKEVGELRQIEFLLNDSLAQGWVESSFLTPDQPLPQR